MIHRKINIFGIWFCVAVSVCFAREAEVPVARELPAPAGRVALAEKRPVVFHLSLSADAKYVSEGLPGRILVWDIASGKKIERFLDADQASFLPNGLLFLLKGRTGRFYESGQWDSPVAEIFFGSDEQPIVVQGFSHFDPTRQSLVLAECNKFRPPDQKCWVTRYDLQSGAAFRLVPERKRSVTPIAYSHISNMLILHDQGEEPGLELWDLARSRRVRTLPCSSKDGISGSQLRLSPDGRHLVATNLCEDISIWDLSSNGEKVEVKLPFWGSPMPIEFSPDGQFLLVLANDRSGSWLAILEMNTLEIVNLYSKPLDSYAGVSFSSDGRYLVLQDFDYRVEEFVAEDGRRIPTRYKVPYISIFEFKDMID